MVQLSIYDSSGKEVKLLFIGKQVNGLQMFQWDGTDNEGKNLQAGAYFLNLKTGGSTLIKKIIKLK